MRISVWKPRMRNFYFATNFQCILANKKNSNNLNLKNSTSIVSDLSFSNLKITIFRKNETFLKITQNKNVNKSIDQWLFERLN